MLSLLTYLIFSTHVKQEGHSLMKKENTQISRLLHSSAVMLVNSAALRYFGYRDSPTVSQKAAEKCVRLILCLKKIIIYVYLNKSVLKTFFLNYLICNCCIKTFKCFIWLWKSNYQHRYRQTSFWIISYRYQQIQCWIIGICISRYQSGYWLLYRKILFLIIGYW